MAIHNDFRGYAQVVSQPNIFKFENGEYKSAVVLVGTIRGKRDAGNGLEHVRYDVPMIRTGNPRNVEEINSWKQLDMVEVKGTITTRELNKKTICPHCKASNVNKSVVTFINPIYCSKRETNITKEHGISLLRQRCEISNSATLSGMLIRDPEFYKSEKGIDVCQFQIAVLRKFRIIEDNPDVKADFIWIKTFGKIAKDCYKALRKGSTIFVDGFLQVRPFKKELTCSECEKTYEIEDSAVEVVPYSVEYLRDFVEQDEIERQKDEEARAKADALLASLSQN